MFFLMRMAFWVTLVLAFLPLEQPRQEAEAPQLSAVDAFSAATAAMSDVGSFCERQKEACAVGGQVIGALARRAQANAHRLYDMATTKSAEPSASEAKATHSPAPPMLNRAAQQSQQTLTPSDLAAPWRGPDNDRAPRGHDARRV